MEGDTTTIYELGYHITTTLPEEKLPAEVSAIKAVLENAKVEVIAEEYPKHTALAYTIVKKNQSGTIKSNDAYFGWVKFAVASSEIEAIKTAFDANDNIIRFIIVKTVRENTMPVKPVAPKGEEVVANEVKSEDAPETAQAE